MWWHEWHWQPKLPLSPLLCFVGVVFFRVLKSYWYVQLITDQSAAVMYFVSSTINFFFFFLVQDSLYVSITSILHVFLAKNLFKWDFPFSSLTNCIRVHFSWVWLAWSSFVEMLVKYSTVKSSHGLCVGAASDECIRRYMIVNTRERNKLFKPFITQCYWNTDRTFLEFFSSGISDSYLPWGIK